ncbi:MULTISPECIES: hypothetical protein [unclassified Curtobacterium]|uniref:hypothetical protein n=1 Tax=unclassified Curtobacterium TaxID=257496 RepID=UPI00226B8BEE|nr:MULTISPECIES: hypothetical protein [unclassified Curtobacterium]
MAKTTKTTKKQAAAIANGSLKPISPELHGLIDYGFAASNLLLPRVFGLRPGARRLFAVFGLAQGGLNAVTAQPNALTPAVSFANHGRIEKSSGLLYIALSAVFGVLAERRARRYWLAAGAALVAVYNLTDWNASRTTKKPKRRR